MADLSRADLSGAKLYDASEGSLNDLRRYADEAKSDDERKHFESRIRLLTTRQA